MTFTEFRIANATRCERAFPQCNDWSACDWATALAGEVGEACNLIKKRRRGDTLTIQFYDDLAKELADIVTYCDLLAHHFRIDLEEAVRAKFNEVSDRVGSNVKL